MLFDSNGGGNPNYYPNSFGGPEPEPTAAEPPFEVSSKATRQPYTHPNNDFVQAGDLYRKVMTDMDRDHLTGNIVSHLGGAQKRIQLRQAALFFKADPDYGRRVADGLNLDRKEIEQLASMSHEERAKATTAALKAEAMVI
jgi:catalase